MKLLGPLLLLALLSLTFASRSSSSTSSSNDKHHYGNGEPFKDAGEYAGWLEYLGRTFVLVGDIAHLPLVIRKLENLQSDLTAASDRQLVSAALESFRHHSRGYRQPSNDSVAVKELVRNLVKGHYEAARAIAKAMIKQSIPLSETVKKIAMAFILIKYEMTMKKTGFKAPMTLWMDYWRLGPEEMSEIVMFANSVRKGREARLGEHMRFRKAIEARVRINLKKDVDGLLESEELRKEQVEWHLLRAGKMQAMGDYCDAVGEIRKAVEHVQSQESEMRRELEAFEKRAQRLCQWKYRNRTWKALCQTGKNSEFPLGEMLGDGRQSATVAKAERLFFSQIWAGHCEGAKDELERIESILPDVKERRKGYAKDRMAYMKDAVQKCHESHPKGISEAGRAIVQELSKGDYRKACQEWNEAYKDEQAPEEAKDVKIAIGVYRFPRAVYAPCLGNSILSADRDVNLQILAEADKIADKAKGTKDEEKDTVGGSTSSNCDDSDPDCHRRKMKANYIAGKFKKAKAHAKKLGDEPEALQMLACLDLCCKKQSAESIRSAQNYYEKLMQSEWHPAHVKVGQDLTRGMQDSLNESVSDLFSVKYGTTIRAVSKVLETLMHPCGCHKQKGEFKTKVPIKAKCKSKNKHRENGDKDMLQIPMPMTPEEYGWPTSSVSSSSPTETTQKHKHKEHHERSPKEESTLGQAQSSSPCFQAAMDALRRKFPSLRPLLENAHRLPCDGLADSMRRELEPMLQEIERKCKEEAARAAHQVAVQTQAYVHSLEASSPAGGGADERGSQWEEGLEGGEEKGFTVMRKDEMASKVKCKSKEKFKSKEKPQSSSKQRKEEREQSEVKNPEDQRESSQGNGGDSSTSQQQQQRLMYHMPYGRMPQMGMPPMQPYMLQQRFRPPQPQPQQGGSEMFGNLFEES